MLRSREREEIMGFLKGSGAEPPRATVHDRAKGQPTETAKQTTSGFTLTPLGELFAKPDVPVEYVVENLLVAGTVACIVAKPKVGKSTLARNLCLSVSRGIDFLGLKTKQGSCIYLALEEREEDLKNDFRAMGADGSEPISTHASAAPAEGIDAACDLVRERRPVLIVVDPLFRLARIKDEKAYAETYAALGPLIDVAREVGTLVLLVHHAGKSAKADAIDSPLGSTAIGGAVCTVMLLKKQTESGTRTLQTVTRIGQEMPETVLRFDSASRSLSLGPSKDEADVQAAEEAILEYLRSMSEPKTEPEIDEAVEGKTGLKRKAIRALATRGKVTREGGGKKGDPYRYAFLFPCSQDIAGTREQETGKEPKRRINTGDILVPDSSLESILVPAPEPDETPGGEWGLSSSDDGEVRL
ncbi:MAG: AAA family ATPase [Candidatus Acidiferrum sp.]